MCALSHKKQEIFNDSIRRGTIQWKRRESDQTGASPMSFRRAECLTRLECSIAVIIVRVLVTKAFHARSRSFMRIKRLLSFKNAGRFSSH